MAAVLPTPPSADPDAFRMYYEHQYERIAQLEQQRLTFTNLIIGLSVLAFSVAFSDLSKLNVVSAIGLPVVVILTNLISILFNHRSRAFIKMHQARAETALERMAPDLHKIDKGIPKPIDSNRDLFRRAALQDYLHWILALVAFMPIAAYFRLI